MRQRDEVVEPVRIGEGECHTNDGAEVTFTLPDGWKVIPVGPDGTLTFPRRPGPNPFYPPDLTSA